MDQETARRGADLLATDIEAALGFEVHIDETIPERLLRQPSPPGWWVEFTIPALNVFLGCTPNELTPSGMAYELVRRIHDDILTRSGRIWPAAPDGGDQPLLPTVEGWSGPGGSIPYGQVKVAKDPDPSLDGVVRWWLPHSYDGLIASHSGDVCFSFWEFHGDEQLITPGMPVTWLIGEGSHGKYAKASEVRPAQP
ncbi:hypothetical protein [Nocardia jinanensis]|uniref:Uncharacterized protein n=1 Tax=Nocardia jinanensis TaxID=382504 RepID=A0A917RSM6_9NOCA|nr:hypothetical protein [Nocardia jinanensis]GGL22142.1 hypothetical protein GCM10011588_41420 [Nocardia jinanensis]